LEVVEIRFRNAKIRKACHDPDSFRDRGADFVRKLRQRLDELDAASCLDDFRHLPGRCEELKGNRKGQLSLRLAGGWRLVFSPDHDPFPTKADGGLNWNATTAVVIEEIVDYHD